jgi:hypothetical protein
MVMKKEIIKFLEENKVELFEKLVELELVFIDEEDDDEDRLSVDDLMFEVGCYEKGNDLIDSEDICVLLEGLDVSFDRKFVKRIYDDESSEFEFEFKGEKIFGLGYNV